MSGRWYSAYDGQTVTNAADIEIDHVVALKEAWDSGAFAWDDARRAAYGNDLTDPRTLVAVTASSNQAKSDMPSGHPGRLPPRRHDAKQRPRPQPSDQLQTGRLASALH